MQAFELSIKPEALAGLAVLLFVVGIAIAVWKKMHRPPSPEEVERLRRLEINRKGKIIAGEIVEICDSLIVFSYLVAGVSYTASQDTSDLSELLPGNAMSLLGPACVKFDPRNPANSIVLCEGWIRQTPAHEERTHAR